MSIIASVAKTAAGTKGPTGTKPAVRVFPKTKWTLVAVSLLAFAGLIPASQATNTEHSSAGSTNPQSETEALPVSEHGAAPQMSERDALDAYGKLPLSFIPNDGQTDKAVRYYAQGAG